MTSRLLVVRLALAALLRDRLQLLGHLAMILGIVVPLLTVLGAKNGAVTDLLARLADDPSLLLIETADNAEVTDRQIADVAGIPGVIFVVPKSRSQTNWVRVRSPQGSHIRNAVLLPTGPGDPVLAGLAEPAPGEVAVSAELGERLSIRPGDAVEIVTDAPGRPRQGRTAARVAAVLPPGRLSGQAVLVQPSVADEVEAFGDGYAVPGLGIPEGLDPAGRRPTHEGLRINVAEMDDVAPVRRQVEALLRRDTLSAAAEIDTTRRTIANLNAAFALVALVGFLGVAAALIGAQVNDVARYRRVLATLNLMGFDRRDTMLVPLVQSAVTTALGLLLSAALFWPSAALAERILDPGAATAGSFVHLRGLDLAVVGGCAAAITIAASLLAARRIATIEPAIILREAA